ncbi:MAG: 50S ribosomal protein L9 [Patescibacteria group bacterium]
MKVILLENVKKVGQKGALVTVADGYALNVLIPKKLAAAATADNLKKYEQTQKDTEGKAASVALHARELMAGIKDKTLQVGVKASETGTLFKSLHEADVVAEVKKQWGIDIPPKSLTLDPIKKIGTYQIPVELTNVKGTLTLTVVAD